MTTHYQCSTWWLAGNPFVCGYGSFPLELLQFYQIQMFKSTKLCFRLLGVFSSHNGLVAKSLGTPDAFLLFFSVAPLFCQEFLNKMLIFEKKPNKPKCVFVVTPDYTPQIFHEVDEIGPVQRNCSTSKALLCSYQVKVSDKQHPP